MIHLGIKFRPRLFQQLKKGCTRLNDERNKKLCYLCSPKCFRGGLINKHVHKNVVPRSTVNTNGGTEN